MGTYHIFLSCEGDLLINNESIEKFLTKWSGTGISFDRREKPDNLSLSKEDLDDLEQSSIYIINTHKDFDKRTCWELGYAMGKGMKIIGYYNGKDTIKIHKYIQELFNIPPDINHFLEKIDRSLEYLKPKEYILKEKWDKQYGHARKELEGP